MKKLFGIALIAALATTAVNTPVKASSAGTIIKVHSLSSFQQEVRQNTEKLPVILKFTGSWCGWCTKMKPIDSKIAAEFAGQIKFIEVILDSDRGLRENSEIIGSTPIRTIPHYLYFDKDGVELGLRHGSVPENVLRTNVNQMLLSS